MDLLSQHEAFLRAIFDAPDDDTPRLVYADFLQEQGDEDRAEFIRVQCELALNPWEESTDRARRLIARERELSAQLLPDGAPPECAYLGGIDRSPVRGFGLPGATFVVTDALLADPVHCRWRAIRSAPALFGASALITEPGVLVRPEYVEVLFALPAAQRVTGWVLSGHVREELSHSGAGAFDLIDMVQQPVITTAGVEVLARHKGARRITELDLRNNNLDNDAARVLVQSPYLDNLKRLQLLEGNRFRGKVWQQVIERFGEDVVG